MLVHSRFVGDIIALAADNFSGTIQHDATLKDGGKRTYGKVEIVA